MSTFSFPLICTLAKGKVFYLHIRLLLQLLFIRYAYIDYAIDRLSKTRDLSKTYLFISYDAACSFRANVLDRFNKLLPESKDLISRTQFSIDALHVNDHLERCMYLLSAAYQDCTGHFHGVGTEQYWSENNQMGPQTRQMNPGHRQDKIVAHHNDWNWKKLCTHGGSFFNVSESRHLKLFDSLDTIKRSDNSLGSVC